MTGEIVFLAIVFGVMAGCVWVTKASGVAYAMAAAAGLTAFVIMVDEGLNTRFFASAVYGMAIAAVGYVRSRVPN